MSDAETLRERKAAALAAKLEAEAEKFMAEARKAAAEAAAAEYRAVEAELDAQERLDEDKRFRASDDYHRVYRFNGAVTDGTVNACIKKLTEWHRVDPTCTIEILFNSPGGEIFNGMALFDFITELGNQGHKTITGGAGMAASMAGILTQSGQVRYLTSEAWMLIHRAAFGAVGQTFEVEDRLELIKKIEKRIIDIFVTRSGGKMSAAKIRKNWDRKDWWLTAQECLEFGLIDEIRGAVPVNGMPDDEGSED